MATDPDPNSVNLPESNADAIATKMVFENIDLDGTDLVNVLELLLLRAKQVVSMRERLGQFDQHFSAGHLPEQEDFNAELLDGMYEPICLKWFLSRALKALSERLEFEVNVRQQHLRPICSIVYSNDGEVESFRLDSTGASPSEQG